MLSIFSYVFWSSICLLWRNVYLDLLSSLWLGFVFFFILSCMSCLYVLEINPLSLIHFSCKYFLPFYERKFSFWEKHCLMATSYKIMLYNIMEKAVAPHSSTLAWKIPWMEEPGRLQSLGSRRVRHDWATSLSLFTFMHWRRKWQPTPVFLPGESQGRGSLVGCCLWSRTESDMTEVT